MPGGPLEDAIETAVEVRDCLAINDEWWENALDCGFATWEVGTGAAKLVTLLSGVGAPLAAAAYAADEASDLPAAVRKATDVLRKAPASMVEPLARLISTQFGSVGQ